jgi:hypothetical protein
MAVCGGKPRKIRTGIVIKLVPPTRAPKVLPMIPTTKMIDRFTRSIAVHPLLFGDFIPLDVELPGLNPSIVFEHFFRSLSGKEGTMHAGGGTPWKENPSIPMLLGTVAHDENIGSRWLMIQPIGDFSLVPNDERDLLNLFHQFGVGEINVEACPCEVETPVTGSSHVDLDFWMESDQVDIAALERTLHLFNGCPDDFDLFQRGNP